MRCKTLAGIAGLLLVAAASAHHSPATLYFLDKTVLIDGVVSKYSFVNPHVRVYVDVTNADGSVEQWMAEGGSPNALRRSGWTGAELKAGDRIRVMGNPTRDGSKFVHWVTITRPDGSELFGEDIDFGAVDRLRRAGRE